MNTETKSRVVSYAYAMTNGGRFRVNIARVGRLVLVGQIGMKPLEEDIINYGIKSSCDTKKYKNRSLALVGAQQRKSVTFI